MVYLLHYGIAAMGAMRTVGNVLYNSSDFPYSVGGGEVRYYALISSCQMISLATGWQCSTCSFNNHAEMRYCEKCSRTKDDPKLNMR